MQRANVLAEDTPQYKTTDKPVTSFKDLNLSSGFRLQQAKQLIQQPAVSAEEVVKETATAVQNEEVTVERFRNAAAAYAKEKNKMLITALMRAEMINKVENNIGVIEIENASQRDGFESYRQDFLDFIRKYLSNSLINFTLEERKNEGGAKKVYTPIEKFEAMIEKNPLLKDLKARLDMELDY